ncbi:YtxH domain-containing protein [Halobacillus locisalis]|uniref:YtxH domain-containing protein n=1 Tax=Halobacillus locisalis TaxID=220753 RepID=A0A838CWZ7_9BACI|nr:YtxH domain-containing protein [Halobacillus locisalis]MBA2176444.1 YtxH domain-containing protein [Halobacillus locisalis]
MGQHKLWKGVMYGAIVGGALMLLDKETRSYVGDKSRSAGTKCKGYIQHPSEAIHSLRMNYEYMSKQLNKGVEELLELLSKAEDMLNKVGEINQEVENQLKAVGDSKEAS